VIIVFPENRKYRCVVRIGFQKTAQEQKRKGKVQQKNNNNNIQPRPGARGGSEKLDSSNQATTHSGTGEKKTLNINVVGKNS